MRSFTRPHGARYYFVVRTTEGKSEEELSRIVEQVLISALAVPVGYAPEDDEVKGRTSRLTALLGLTKTPKRTRLLQEAVSLSLVLQVTTLKRLFFSCLAMS